jgi:acyl-CoA thioesterase YciA
VAVYEKLDESRKISTFILWGRIVDRIESLPDRQPTLRVVPMPQDINVFGDIFGGWVMANVDLAGGMEAMRHARGRVATVAVNAFQFHQPVSAGDLVSFYAEVVSVGKTSITIKVKVLAERHPQDPVFVRVTEATLVYVALDEHGNKRDVFAKSA